MGVDLQSASGDSPPISAINVTPFVDVVLVLLVIFMVTAPALMKDTLGIQLPKASTSDRPAPQSFGLAVTRDGRLVFNGNVVSDAVVLAETKAQLAKNKELQVIISADGAALHEQVVHAIDLVKSAGVNKFALQIQRRQQGS